MGSGERSDLTATGRVILGMISLGCQSGYEIKQFVDGSTRHFWAASYGQIYPELHRLEEAGFVRGTEAPAGGRARTSYELTPAGRRALRAWLKAEGEAVFELRDEGMLRLFFSDSAPPEERLRILDAMRDTYAAKLDRLRAIEPLAKDGPPGPFLTLQFGMGHTEWMVRWCERTAQRLRHEAAAGNGEA